jgi:hypothetical protein
VRAEAATSNSLLGDQQTVHTAQLIVDAQTAAFDASIAELQEEGIEIDAGALESAAAAAATAACQALAGALLEFPGTAISSGSASLLLHAPLASSLAAAPQSAAAALVYLSCVLTVYSMCTA